LFTLDARTVQLRRPPTPTLFPYTTLFRSKVKTQDGRQLRRYKRRWKVERLFAWLQNFRRIIVRYEYHAANYQGMVHLGCLMILIDRKSTRLNSSHVKTSYAVFCLKKKKSR